MTYHSVHRSTFRITTIAVAMFWVCATFTATAAAQTANRISQYGVTFVFDGQYEYGQFANGDYWVAVNPDTGIVKITQMTPAFDERHNGWMVNPTSLTHQGWDARNPGDPFDRDLVPPLPYEAKPNETILKSISRGHFEGEAHHYSSSRQSEQNYTETMAVLTVLKEVPPNRGKGHFRPPYFGTGKPMYAVADMKLDLLPRVQAPAAPGLESLTRRFERVQIDHFNLTGSRGRRSRPLQHMNEYGASIAIATGEAALRLMLDEPTERKMPLLIAYVQYGIDLHAMYNGGVRWRALGGQNLGRKLPMVFAAVMLDNESMKKTMLEAPYNAFHEDGSVYYSPTAKVTLWGQPYGEATRQYWLNQMTDGQRSSKTVRDPYEYIDGGPAPGTSYQLCCNSQGFKGAAMALHLMPPLREVWNYEPFLDYADRWVNHGAWAAPDPYKHKGEGEQDGIGRHPARHGTNADAGGYGSGFFNAMWDTHRKGPTLFMPHIEPYGQTAQGPITVELSSPHVDGVTIHYTLDGSEPTQQSPRYEQPIRITETTTIKARSFKANHHPSAIQHAAFVVE